MIGIILSGLIVIGLSVTKIISKIKDRRDDIERQRQQQVQAKETQKMQANNNNVLGLNSGITQSATPAANIKKPGLKTRFLNHMDNRAQQQFDFDPNQNETKLLDESNALNNKNNHLYHYT